MKLIDHLVPLAEQSEILSLRGTCLYILNMISNTEQGRIELEKQEWISHWNSNLGMKYSIFQLIYAFYLIFRLDNDAE